MMRWWDAEAGILSSVEAGDLPVHPLPKETCSAISATFIARLNKGCRGDDRAGFACFQKNLSTFNALTSILAAKAPFQAHFFCGLRRVKCPS
jgi:hypothetical protein